MDSLGEWREYPGNPRYEVSREGLVRHKRIKKVLIGWENRLGYKYYSLSVGHRKSRRRSAHQIIAETWVPNPLGLPIVRHRNDSPRDNSLENLEWGTKSDNTYDSVRNGTHVQSRKTQCPQGHPYDEANTYRHDSRRHCRACGARRAREQREKTA